MPIYTYKCRECGHQLDKMQKASEAKAPKCEVCGSETHRVFYPVGIIFKGSGFYKTDNRTDKNKVKTPVKPAETKTKDNLKKKNEDKKKVVKN